MDSMDTDLFVSHAIWSALYARKFLVGSIIVASATVAVLISYLFTPIYLTEATLIPAESADGSGALQRLGDLGGLASLGGLSIGTSSKETTESIALLKSRQLAMGFIRDENLLPIIFAKKWDPDRHTWTVSSDDIPTANDAYRYFNKKIRYVSEDKKTGLVTLRIEWRDRRMAVVWAEELIKRVNDEMRGHAIQESNASIGLLKEQLASTSVVPLQQSISALIEAQVKRRTYALVRPDFAFRIIDPPVVPDSKNHIFPNRILFLFLGILTGLVLSVLLVLPTALLAGQRTSTIDPSQPHSD